MTIARRNLGLPDIPRSQLRAEWRFIDYGDQTLRDWSGGGRNMTLGGNAGSEASDPTWSTAGLTFDGTNDYCGTAAVGIATFSGTAFSVVAALRATGTGNRTIIGPSGSAAGTGGIQVIIDSSHQLTINKANTIAVGSSASAAYTGQWLLVGFTYDGTTARFYRNGAPDGAATNAQTMTVVNSYIGKRGNTGAEFFNGEIAYLAAWDRALTQPEHAYAAQNIARYLGLLPARKRVWFASGGTVYDDAGTGILTGIGSGDDVNAYVDTGSATSIFVGSGVDAAILLDTGTGVLISVGSGADAPTYADSGAGVLSGVGSGADTATLLDTGSATSILAGNGADAPTFADTGTGVLIASGSGADAPLYSDTGAGLAALFGSGSDVAILVDSGTGVLIAIGSGADTGGGAPIINACATLTMQPKPIAVLARQPKPIATIAQRPC